MSIEVKCNFCYAKLVDIEVTKESNVYNAFVVKCFRCNGKSLKTRPIKGSVTIIPKQGVSYDIEDVSEADSSILEYFVTTKKE